MKLSKIYLIRWSSAYLLLESVKRAFDGGLFDEFKPEEIFHTNEFPRGCLRAVLLMTIKGIRKVFMFF